MAKVLFSLKDTFLETIDKMAQDEHRTRSEFIREALRVYMKKQQNSRINKNAHQNAIFLENLLD